MTAASPWVHPPLAVRLRKGQTVLDRDGRQGRIVGFRTTRSWVSRRLVKTSWAVVEFSPTLRRLVGAADLSVVGETAHFETTGGNQGVA